jgi:hypothetical protein
MRNGGRAPCEGQDRGDGWMRDGLPDDFCGDEASRAGDNELHFVFCLNKLLNVVVRRFNK